MANDFELIENPRLSGAKMLNQGINNAANLYGQVKQLQAQQEELKMKKQGQKFDAATSLFKSAPDSIKVQIFNNTIRPLSKEMFGYDAPELTVQDMKSPIIQNMLKEQEQIDKMNVDPAIKKRMYQTTGVKALGALGEEKAAVDASLKDLTRPDVTEPPIPIMKKGDGFINPLNGEAIIYDPTKKYQVINDPSENPNLYLREFPPLPASENVKISDMTASRNQLRELIKKADETGFGSGNPYVEKARGSAANPFQFIDPQAQKFKQFIAQTKQIIGKGLEGGVLRKEDEIKYESILPRAGDTKEILNAKAQQIDQLIKNKQDETISGFRGAYRHVPSGGVFDPIKTDTGKGVPVKNTKKIDALGAKYGF